MMLLVFQDLYCVRSDLGNLLKALGRLDEAKVIVNGFAEQGLHNVSVFIRLAS